MAIKGLQRTGQTPGLARAGVIRLGYKARKCQNEQCKRATEPLEVGPTCAACGQPLPNVTFPKESPHFILTDAPGLADILGTDAPTELKIYFPFDEIDRVFPSYMHLWATSALRCRGDGEQILYAINPTTGRVTVREGVVQEEFTEDRHTYQPGEVLACPGLERNLYAKCAHCKPNALLVIMLRDVPRLAYYQISTTSIHNIVELTEQLEYVREQVRRLTGEAHIAGVPFILRRVARIVSVPNLDKAGKPKMVNGKPQPKVRAEKYFLELEIEPEWVARMVRGISRLADPLRGLAALPAPAESQQPEAESLLVASMPASHYTDPPQWEPRPDDEATEGEWWAADDTAEAAAQRDAAIERNQAEAAGELVRPLSAEDTADFVTAIANRKVTTVANPTEPASPAARGLFVGKLNEVFAPNPDADNMRRSVIKFLFGVDSSKELTKAEVSAGLEWLIDHKTDDGDYILNAYAIDEARAIERQVLLDAGQTELPF